MEAGGSEPYWILPDPSPTVKGGQRRSWRCAIPSSSSWRKGRGRRPPRGARFAVASPDGTIWRLDSRELPLVIPAEELAAALRQRVRYSVELPYPHRGMRVVVSVHDRISDVRSVATAP
jgi:hypothetical protein